MGQPSDLKKSMQQNELRCAEQQSSQSADDDVPGESRSEPGEPETIKRKTSWVWQALICLSPSLR